LKEISRIKSLTQIKAMAHPIRMRLLESFSHKPTTTKQVAEEIGEPPTRLYHHVNALKRAGLIKLVRTGKKRGTTEKYYQTVADQFVVDRRLFEIKSGGKEALSRMQRVTADIFENAMEEIRQSLSGKVAESKGEKGQFVLAHTHIHATPAQIITLEKQINALIKKQGSKIGEKGSGRYGVTVALYRTGSKSGIKERRRK
jgi:DNA-binding transcriptional ArsR family regulator